MHLVEFAAHADHSQGIRVRTTRPHHGVENLYTRLLNVILTGDAPDVFRSKIFGGLVEDYHLASLENSRSVDDELAASSYKLWIIADLRPFDTIH